MSKNRARTGPSPSSREVKPRQQGDAPPPVSRNSRHCGMSPWGSPAWGSSWSTCRGGRHRLWLDRLFTNDPDRVFVLLRRGWILNVWRVRATTHEDEVRTGDDSGAATIDD